MYGIYFYDIIENQQGLFTNDLFKSYENARAWLENELKNDLAQEKINDFIKVTATATEYHQKGTITTHCDGTLEHKGNANGVNLFYIANYDYNNNCIITITRVQEHNGELINE